jgi:hypothetical protein
VRGALLLGFGKFDGDFFEVLFTEDESIPSIEGLSLISTRFKVLGRQSLPVSREHGMGEQE